MRIIDRPNRHNREGGVRFMVKDGVKVDEKSPLMELRAKAFKCLGPYFFCSECCEKILEWESPPRCTPSGIYMCEQCYLNAMATRYMLPSAPKARKQPTGPSKITAGDFRPRGGPDG